MERKADEILKDARNSRHQLFQQLRRSDQPFPRKARLLAELEALRKCQPYPKQAHD